MQSLFALPPVFAAWALIFASCLGWGMLARSPVAARSETRADMLECFWLGFAVLLAALQLWHLFLPIDWRCTVVLGGGGILALARASTGPRLAPPSRTGWSALSVACLVPVLVWLALRGLDYPGNYDSKLYHFTSVRWANEYPVVPGLANLHERLGFNQSYFLFVAWANCHPWFDHGWQVLNSLLCAVLASGFGLAALRVVTGRSTARSDLLQALMLPVVLHRALSPDISSPTPDLAVFTVGIATFVLLVRLLESWGESPDPVVGRALPLVALSAAGCTLKLSFAPFGAGLVLAALLAFFLPLSDHRLTGFLRAWAGLISAGLVLWGIPFLIRGAISSGYPLFPSTLVSWPADWRLPEAEAKATAHWILAWARAPGLAPGEVLGSHRWLAPWLQRMLSDRAQTFALLSAFVGTLLGLTLLGEALVRRQRPSPWLAPFLVLPPALALWFLTAPDPRFADWLLWLAFAWPFAFALHTQRTRIPASLFRRAAGLPPLIAVGLVALHLAYAGVPAGGLRNPPRPATREFVTDHGLHVLISADDTHQLWDAPLPCAPQPKASLALRGTTLREGFRTEAETVSKATGEGAR